MEKDFDLILGSEDFSTKEDALKNIARKYDARVKDIVYIGDRVKDYKIAKRAGSRIIIPYACSWDKSVIKNRKYSKVRIENMGKIEKLIK